jgi:hypothetical protein
MPAPGAPYPSPRVSEGRQPAHARSALRSAAPKQRAKRVYGVTVAVAEANNRQRKGADDQVACPTPTTTKYYFVAYFAA